MDQNFPLTTDDLGKSKERAFAKAVLTKKLTNGKKEIGMNTTHTKEPIEQKEKPKGGQLFETIDLRDYFAAKANEDDIAAHSLKGFKEEYVFDLGNGNKELRIREARWSREEAKYRYADAMLKAREA
jgi:hypothetical protein